VLNLLREETAALGYKKATATHLLYALVGIENSIMQRAIQFQAIDPVKEVHGFLSHELTRPGAKRVTDFELSRTTLHESVIRILEAAAGEAQREGGPVGELRIARALVAGQTGVVADFLTRRKVNVGALREYLALAEGEAEETVETLRLPVSQIETELKKRLLGQDHAIRQILPWIKRLRFGFPRDRGPAAVFLFLGPSGTGKTQLAKELARTIYGSDDQLVMLEMGQFNSKESINIFIGAPPGYVGYGEGKLTNGLRDKPQSVILFDEVEKAHEDVWVALLRFLDEGLISDPAGPTRDGRSCIIVLTSNLGADTLAKRLPAEIDETFQMTCELEHAIRDVVLPYLKRPEIYNRVDDKVIFRPFSSEIYRRLVQRQVETEARRFSDLRGTRLEVMPEVIEWIAQQAVEFREEGARCVPRLVNKFVVSRVIDLFAENEDRPIRKVVISRHGADTVAEEA
jgi:ATP-dependent Clp protease ATP-binding subunit ClpC